MRAPTDGSWRAHQARPPPDPPTVYHTVVGGGGSAGVPSKTTAQKGAGRLGSTRACHMEGRGAEFHASGAMKTALESCLLKEESQRSQAVATHTVPRPASSAPGFLERGATHLAKADASIRTALGRVRMAPTSSGTLSSSAVRPTASNARQSLMTPTSHAIRLRDRLRTGNAEATPAKGPCGAERRLYWRSREDEGS